MVCNDLLENAALVVAHPDDEALWFSSILPRVDDVIICFLDVPSRPDCTAGRRRVAAAYRFSHAQFLGLTESEVFDGADWQSPVPDECGLVTARRHGTSPGYSAERYRQNFGHLRDLLRDRLRGRSCVFTHNPLGEYGHEEHVQVYRAVKALQSDLGFEFRFGNYASNKSHVLMFRYVQSYRTDYIALPTNLALLDQLRQLYLANGCWTWFNDYVGFEQECFLSDASVSQPRSHGHLFPVNYVRMWVPWEMAPRTWRGTIAARWRQGLRNLFSFAGINAEAMVQDYCAIGESISRSSLRLRRAGLVLSLYAVFSALSA